MAGLRERRVGVELRKGLALLEYLLQTEEMTVDTLTVCGPCSVLEMTSDSLAEEFGASLILYAM